MDDEDFLDEIENNEAEVATEPKAETPQEPEQPASEPEPPAAEQPATVTVEVPKPEPGFVPFGAVLDERDKRKKLEAEVEELRKQRQAPQEPVEMPDVFDEGFVPTLTQQFEQRLYQQSLQMSERFARNQFGDDTTEAALKWATARCDTDPFFNGQVRNSGDPVGFAVREYQRDQIVQQVSPDDFQQFVAWREAQKGLQQQQPAPATTPAPNPSPQTKPPKSLASAPSAGPATSDPVLTDDEIFAETFAR